MFSRQTKAGVFVLEGLNAVATTYYFYYLYFFTRTHFNFTARDNLWLAAAMGLIYTVSAIYAGKFAQRHGYFVALKAGLFTLAGVLFCGGFVHGVVAHIIVAAIGTAAMCFTWPTFEAIISEQEPRASLQTLLGIYNLTWAGCSAISYFAGGAMLQYLGDRSMFFIPAAIHVVQLGLTFWLEKRNVASSPLAQRLPEAEHPSSTIAGGITPKGFLWMGWVANPFAYLAINTVIAVIPSLAKELNFSAAFAGFFCSIWFFVRAGSFELLRVWSKWHYRLGWLLGAYLGMIAGFGLMLLSKNLAVLLVAQVMFGFSVGLVYYSSIFYSMDVGDTKGEHGGFHEGMIGLGSCAGPAVGAAALHCFPRQPNSGAVAVLAILVCGFVALLAVSAATRNRKP